MRILIAINGSSHAGAALRLGAQIAQRGSEPLTLLAVLESEAHRSPAMADAILARACELVQPQCPKVHTRVRIGRPAPEIVRFADEGHYDLVIVGENPNRNLRTLFLRGSAAARVVELAPCPVIVAKREARPIRRILLCDSGNAYPSIGLPAASPGIGGAGPSWTK